MNSRERVLAAVQFKATDRVPVIAQVFGFAARYSRVPLEDYLRDGELLARCQLRAFEDFGYDAVFALMDAYVETEAIGSVLDYRANQYPVIGSWALTDAAALSTLKMPDPARAGRMPGLLAAIRSLRRQLGQEVPVVGCVLGPMTLATQLLGMEASLYLAIDAPEQFAQLLDFATDVAIRFGSEQLTAGADLPMVFEPSASPDVIPAQFYREFVLPRLFRLFSSLKQAGAPINWLHTAGPIDPVLPFYARMGVELANIDYCVDPRKAQQAVPGICLNGNLKPLSFVEAEAEEIYRQSTELLHQFAARGGFILSTGCEIPLEAKPENITAMVRAARLES
jgi:uroporphyrinogen decarboxylase